MVLYDKPLPPSTLACQAFKLLKGSDLCLRGKTHAYRVKASTNDIQFRYLFREVYVVSCKSLWMSANLSVALEAVFGKGLLADLLKTPLH